MFVGNAFLVAMALTLVLGGLLFGVLLGEQSPASRQKVSEARHEGEARTQAIVDAAADGILTVDAGGTVDSLNPATERLFGYHADEVLGQHVTLLMPEPFRSGRDGYLELGVHREVLGRHRDGTLFPLDLAVSATRLGQRRIYTGILRDITEQKRAEADRERLLSSEHEARARAEQALRVKEEFLWTLGHELRTPLTAVLGWAHVLRTRSVPEDVCARALATIERGALAEAGIVDDLLDASRIAAGKIQLSLAPTALDGTIDAAIELVRESAARKGVAIDEPARAGVAVMADPGRLQQIVLNLLGNAVKFTPAGGHVQVATERRGSVGVLRVSDTGEGISGDFLPHLFERFRQADSSMRRPHGGLGLGLSIVKHLVELHEGTIVAESEGPGRGARFTVSLPAAEMAAPEAAEGKTLSLTGWRILLVEDDPESHDIIAAVLRQHGATLRSATRALEALAILEEEDFDVLVSDVGLPDIDGYELLHRARALRRAQEHPIHALALTAYAEADDVARARGAGFERHMAKPFVPEQLVSAVADLACGGP